MIYLQCCEGIISIKSRPKSVYDFLGLWCRFTVQLYVCLVSGPDVIYFILLWHNVACLYSYSLSGCSLSTIY